MKFSGQTASEIRKSLEAQLEQHRDGYNQALGALQLMDHLIGDASASVSQDQLEKMLDARLVSVDPLKDQDGKHGE